MSYPEKFHRNSQRTPRHPPKDDNGRYLGSLGEQGELSPEQRRTIRQALCSPDAPLQLSELAAKAGVPMTRADTVAQLAKFVEIELVRNNEVEMKWAPVVKGQGERFAGWAGTKLLKTMVEHGLA
jgi:hypothetical protein